MHSSRRSAVSLSSISSTTSLQKKMIHLENLSSTTSKLISYTTENHHLISGSTYTGEMNNFGMTHYGEYKFPHGVIYKGQFWDGMFHGKGTLYYPNGTKIECRFLRGHLMHPKFIFPDGLSFESKWDYCKMPDRRFLVEQEGLRPAPMEYRTNAQPTVVLPKGCYDVENGFYYESNECIEHPSKGSIKIDIPNKKEKRHILKHYRKYGDDPIGYRKDLYEVWTNGKRSHIDALEAKYKKQKYY